MVSAALPAECDVVVIGGGHNGLVCSAMLARRGLRVVGLERWSSLGGAACTEAIAPGFRNSLASYTVGLLHPQVIEDLRLHEHGLRIVPRPISNFLPLDDGYLLSGGAASLRESVATFSQADADRLPDYEARLQAVADVLREIALLRPPALHGPMTTLVDAWRHHRSLRHVSRRCWNDLLDLMTLSAGEYLDRWFESDAIKGLFGFDAVVGNYASPWHPGTAYVLLHHVFGIVNGKPGAWGHAIGGMGAVSDAIAASARAAGAEWHCECEVAAIGPKQGGWREVHLADGRTIRTKRVAAAVHPVILYQRLLDTSEVPDELCERIDNYHSHSATLRINLALDELPTFDCLQGESLAEQAMGSGIVISPSLDYQHSAWESARRSGGSESPVVEMLIPSTIDDSLAPAGKHVASLFCQHFRYSLPAGQEWDENHRNAAADAAIAAIEHYAPGFSRSIVAKTILSPRDLESRFALIGGDIFHGALRINQLYAARPALGYGDYRTSADGVWLCASGAHPGGGVSGLPGRNAALAMLADKHSPSLKGLRTRRQLSKGDWPLTPGR